MMLLLSAPLPHYLYLYLLFRNTFVLGVQCMPSARCITENFSMYYTKCYQMCLIADSQRKDVRGPWHCASSIKAQHHGLQHLSFDCRRLSVSAVLLSYVKAPNVMGPKRHLLTQLHNPCWF